MIVRRCKMLSIFSICLLVSHILISECKTIEKTSRHDVRKFPEGFLFGTATAAYQVEGAWDADGKTENVWDHLTHTNPSMILDYSNGDIADNSYYLYKRDVEMMRELGLDFYRFSLSWTRILPTSFPDKINQAGVEYYNNLINEMLKYNIQPMISLFHWDLPQKLQELGGWANPHIVDWFGDYARIAYELFGDRVKLWITINEPYEICHYVSTSSTPSFNRTGISEYMCAKNILLAHARAYHIYDKEFRASQGGSIFITLSSVWYEPETENEVTAAEEANQFHWAQYSHPIFSESGDFPPIMKERIAAKSASQGFARSRLPEFTPEEVDYVRGSSDFFGLNHYISYYVYKNQSVVGYYDSPSFLDDVEVMTYQLSEWKIGESDYTKFVPWGFYKLLTKIREDYGNPPVYITENGFATHGGLQDDDRITYYRYYLDALLDAVDEGSDIRAYTAWSLMDNFEWNAGYTERFGLYEVDYESPERTRTPRKSAFVYKHIVRTRALDMHYEPDTTEMIIDEGHYLLGSYILISECKTIEKTSRHDVRKFPESFLFGTATASYQVEGAWDADGKTENIWDHLTHTNPCLVADCSNGDIADNSYNLYKRDVEMMRELGIDFYRFSLSWTRILPTSFPDKINQAGVDYYNNLINEMLKYNIQPIITLFHWDLPQKLQELGGWANPHIVDWFGDYARIAYELFGDRVKLWITINEPYQICYYGYGSGSLAPAIHITGIAEYMCAKNLLLAHARAYHIYDKEFRPSQGGSIFITLSAMWYEPETENEVTAAEEANQFHWAQYSHPIFSESGDFPPIMKERIAAKSASQGFARSRLPEFTPEEVDYVRGSSDFFGLNHYTSYYVYRNQSVVGYYDSPSFLDDVEVMTYQLSEWKIGESEFIKFVPWGFYKLLTKIREDYGNPPVYITENGFSTNGGLEDDDRITYYLYYLDAMLDAVDEGSDIRAYTAWSLMDNFEWMRGYIDRFGLYEVDYESPERTRTPRKSAFVYKHILRTRELDLHYEPETTEMTIDEGH